MRVALIDPSLFTLPYDAGLAAGLTANGADLTFHGRAIKPADGDAGNITVEEDFYRLSGQLGRLPQKLRLLVKGIDHGFSMLALLQKLQRGKPDVIHFQWLPLPMIDAALLDRFRAIAPVLLTVHDTNPFNGDPTARLQRLGVRRALLKCDRLIVHTRQAVSRLVESGIDPHKMTIVPHGAFTAAPRPPRSVAPMEKLEFVLFGKIKPYKGADILIDAFSRLPEQLRRRATVRIIGQSYMKLDPLRAQIQNANLSDAVSIEDRFVSDDEVEALFRPGVVAVFPYREIEASGVMSQAIAHGRPIIASEIGLFAEMLRDGVHGSLVPSNDPVALSAAMSRMITEPDFVVACEAGVAQLAKAVPNWNEVGRMTLQLYRTCVANRAGPMAPQSARIVEGVAS